MPCVCEKWENLFIYSANSSQLTEMVDQFNWQNGKQFLKLSNHITLGSMLIED